MSEKKEFIIPKNVKAEFEIVQNVGLKELMLFIPSAVISIPVILVPISFAFKISIVGSLLVIPFGLVWYRPTRDNIPFWKHVLGSLKFMNRQRKFYYRKDGIRNDQEIEREIIIEESKEQKEVVKGRVKSSVRARVSTNQSS